MSRRARWFRLLVVGFSLLAMGLASVSQCGAEALVDVTSQVTFTKSGLVYNRLTNTFNCLVTVTNTSASVLNGPLFLVLSGLRTNVALINQTGQDPESKPYLNLTVPAGGLPARQSISNVLLKFSNPSRVTFTFDLFLEQPTQAYATLQASSIVFTAPAGNVVLSIPLQNLQVVTSTPDGDVTHVTHQRASISADGSHAGVHSVNFVIGPADTDTEPVVTSTFTYYAASGQLWQITAPLGTGFYLPIDTYQRLITPDGSRVLTIIADVGNTNPAFTVYDQNGNALYQSADVFVELYRAQISPNGRYLLAMGILRSNNVNQDLIRVTDLNAMLSSDLPLSIAAVGIPVISISSDGRFQILYQGNYSFLPSE